MSYKGNPLFSALSLRLWPLSHGQSHRCEYCITHHFLYNNLPNFGSHKIIKKYLFLILSILEKS